MSIESRYENWEINTFNEICLTGAKHAAAALSEAIDRRVAIGPHKIYAVPLPDLSRELGGAETHVTAVYTKVLGQAPGCILFILPDKSSTALAALLQNKEGSTDLATKSDLSVVKECASAALGAYLGAVTQLLHLPLIASRAAVANDMAGALMDAVITELGAGIHSALVLQTTFFEESTDICAMVYFLPDPRTQQVTMKLLETARS